MAILSSHLTNHAVSREPILLYADEIEIHSNGLLE